MPTLNLLIGNVGSGKSLIASKLAKLFRDTIVSMDAIQASVAAGNYDSYDQDKKPVYQAAEEALIETSLKKGISVVIDRTNIDRKTRERFMKIGEKYAATIVAYDWGPGSEEALKRRQINSRGLPDAKWAEIWNFMKTSYEAPTEDEGFHQIIEAPKKFICHAFDFDGTITKGSFPEIGEIIDGTVDLMNDLYTDLSNIIIIWTCRVGDTEAEMRAFLKRQGIFYDFVNENPIFESGSRKVFAHHYYDNRNGFLKGVNDSQIKREL
jgi:predicted kinase